MRGLERARRRGPAGAGRAGGTGQPVGCSGLPKTVGPVGLEPTTRGLKDGFDGSGEIR